MDAAGFITSVINDGGRLYRDVAVGFLAIAVADARKTVDEPADEPRFEVARVIHAAPPEGLGLGLAATYTAWSLDPHYGRALPDLPMVRRREAAAARLVVELFVVHRSTVGPPHFGHIKRLVVYKL
jgi:hypothetical protein